MKTVVIGGSGFIGTRLVQRLAARADQTIVVADVRPNEQFSDLWVDTDVRDPDQLRRVLDDADCVISLAAQHKDDLRSTKLYYEVNVEGTRNVCRIADELGINNMIFTSSVAVYAPCDDEINEDGARSPLTDYGKSKLQAEDIFLHWARSGRNLTIIRPAMVFGEGNRGNLYNLSDQIRKGRFVMVGSGSNRKSMAYVENLAAFIEACVTSLSGVQTYNYVDKPDLTMNQLVAHLYRRIRGGGKPVEIPYFLGLAGGAFFDVLAAISGRRLPIGKMRVRKFCANTIIGDRGLREAGFKPQFTLEEGLDRTIAYEMNAAHSNSGD